MGQWGANVAGSRGEWNAAGANTGGQSKRLTLCLIGGVGVFVDFFFSTRSSRIRHSPALTHEAVLPPPPTQRNQRHLHLFVPRE